MDFDLNRPSFVLCRVNLFSQSSNRSVLDLQKMPVLLLLVRGRHLDFALFVRHHKCLLGEYVSIMYLWKMSTGMFTLFTIIKTLEWAGWAFAIACLPTLRRKTSGSTPISI
jgi:hypothetical protein